jgi:branched-chain amino acid transport system substrate-binding protein
VIVGPFASSEVKSVKDYADKQGILVLSPLSTARSLAIPDDNVLRFTPDDGQEGVALAGLAYADGIRLLVPVSRDDEGNLGLQSAVKETFERLGGKVLPLTKYAASETSFAATAQAVEAAITGAGLPASQVGVYLTAFDEVTTLFGAASSRPALQGVRWYGSDSVALSKGLVEDKTAAAFAAAVSYPNPILGLREADRAQWGPVSDRLNKQLGRTVDAFALASYDALTSAYAAMQKAGTSASAAELRKAIATAASSSVGLTGPLTLNAAGDRAIGNYDFWSVCKNGSNFTWARTATYTASAGGAGRVESTKTC